MKTIYSSARTAWVTLACCAGMAAAGSVSAAAPSVVEPRIAARASGTLPDVPPIPLSSPVGFFRKLLAMTPAEQQSALAGRPEANRKVILQKLGEYEALAPAEQDARLRAMEFHHYMKMLLGAPEPVRAVWLAAIPEEYRALCEERLRLWTILPKELQEYMREQEATLRWLTRWEGATEAERPRLLATLPPDQRIRMEENVARWQAMTPVQRNSAWRGTRQMFDMGPQDQQRVLRTLEASNRIPASRFVERMQQVPESQRDRCLDGFRKFSQLSLVERARYVKSWERWKQMSDAERDIWRQLQARLPHPPPLPAR